MNLITSLEHLAEREIEESSSLLSKERRIAAALIEGAAERSDIYRVAEADVDSFVGELIDGAETTLRDIRSHVVGEEQALKEVERGQKTDADYAIEADERRQRRKLAREEEAKTRLKRETEERERRAEEARRKKEEFDLRERERKEREETRRAERERQFESEKLKERERKRRYVEEREQEREEKRERRRREEEAAKKVGRVHGACEDSNSPLKGSPQKAEKERDLDEVALELLLREGQELAAKSKNRSDTERPESLEPPSRKSLENGVKRKTGDIVNNEKLSKYSNKDHELKDDSDASQIQKPALCASRSGQESLSRNINAVTDKGHEQGKHGEKESFIEVQERNESRNHISSEKIIRSDANSQEREAGRRDSNRSRGPAADLHRRSLICPKSDIAGRNHSPRKRHRTRSRTPESVDRYVPSSARGRSNDRKPHNHKHNETPQRPQREESNQPTYAHPYSLDDRYSSKDTRASYNRERRDRSRDRSRDCDTSREYRASHDSTKSRDRDMSRATRSSRDRDRDRFVERERNRPGGSESDGLRDRDRDRDRNRHRDGAYEKERERRRHDDYVSIRHRSRERGQYRKWSR